MFGSSCLECFDNFSLEFGILVYSLLFICFDYGILFGCLIVVSTLCSSSKVIIILSIRPVYSYIVT